MKIGVVLDQYQPQDGGAFTFQGEVLSAICKSATASRHQFVILSPNDPNIEQRAKASGLEWAAYAKPGFIDRVLFVFLPKLREKLNLKHPLEITARKHNVQFLWYLSPRIPAVDLAYMTIVLDLQHRLQPWFPEVGANGEWEIRERHYARLLPRAAAVIVGTEAGRQEVMDFYRVPADHIHVLPHPTPEAALHQSTNESSQLNLKPGYIFYPAQFWPHKNHVNLLRAVALLRDSGERFQVVLAGSDFGSRPDVERAVAEFDLGDQVKMLGFVSHADLYWLYRNALALAYVSFFGPENLPPLEAFALGCPVIAAAVSGAQEQLGTAALLVDPREPQAIADAIRRLSTDQSLRAELIQRGRARAEKWTTDEFVQGALQIVEEFDSVRRNWL
jgi:glycosyltransferase involved in cell wall biosynthesis